MTPDEVRTLARLGALELPRGQDATLLDADTLGRYARELGAILDHVRALGSLDLEGVPPTHHGMPLPSPLRDDVVDDRLEHARALDQAPRAVSEGFAVPKVVE